eukprot:TRINITY_DN37855_c0_g1_i1.p1 TRINITY_DN37855_c0_g1~~TRINITY_DN37855_c0_g1_i1.p1  ORF type:complete len:680 (+),score=203.46 TRINITY_DN37855_c0_g1_i1:91-2040(+)
MPPAEERAQGSPDEVSPPTTTFSTARLRALGKIVHDDIDMFPFQGIRDEHNEVDAGVLAELVSLMGYAPTEQDIAGILEEVAEYRRTIKGIGLVGGGKITEILRHTHDIVGRHDVSMLGSLQGLQETLNAEREEEQAATTESPAALARVRARHQHPEVLRVAESIIQQLTAAKKSLRTLHRPAAEREEELLAVDAAITTRLWGLRWILTSVAPRAFFNSNDDLEPRDPVGAQFWAASFCNRQISVPSDTFLNALSSALGGGLSGWLREAVRAVCDQCLDGVVTVRRFRRALCLFGPFHELVDNIGFATGARLLSPALSAEQARRRCVAAGPGTYTLVFGEGDGQMVCCWADSAGRGRSCIVTRVAGAWTVAGRGSEAHETLRDVVAARAAIWSKPLAPAADIPAVYQGARGDSDGTAPLHRAAAANSSGLVRALLRSGAALVVDQRTWDPPECPPGCYNAELTPLLAAIGSRVGCPAEVCQLLIGAGADPDALDARGHSALYRAIQHRRPAVIEVLRQAGARCFTAPGTEPLFLCLGPQQRNGWYKHNVIFRDYPPCVHTARAVLRFYAGRGEEACATAEEAIRLVERKLALDARPLSGERCEHTARMEQINREAILRHSRRFARELRPIRRALFEFLYTERLRLRVGQ